MRYPYLSAVFLSNGLFLILLISLMTLFGFEGKSFIALLIAGLIGMSVKSLFFFLPFFRMERRIRNNKMLLQVSFVPFAIYGIWFSTIFIFKIEPLYFDLSFGYIARGPHFYVQLFAVLITGIFTFFYQRKYMSLDSGE